MFAVDKKRKISKFQWIFQEHAGLKYSCYQIVFDHGAHVVTTTKAAQGSVTPVLPHFYFKSVQHSTANRTICRPTQHKPGRHLLLSFCKFVSSCSEMLLDAKGNNSLMPAHLSHTFVNVPGHLVFI